VEGGGCPAVRRSKGYYAGGFALPANLPKGLYTIQWKTAKMESNAIDIEIL
jgi:hypothetical protein